MGIDGTPALPATAHGNEPRPVRTPTCPCTCDVARLKRRYDQLKSLRSVVEQVWDQIEQFFMPLGSGTHPFTNLTEGSVEWNRPGIWDSTAIDATGKLAASIHGSVTSPAIRWFKLAWRDVELRDDTEASTWLDQVADAVFNALQDSDFNSEIASADADLVAFGNTFVVEEAADGAAWKGLDFETVPIREAYFEPDSKGEIEIFYRRLSWSAVQILDKFGTDGTPEHIKLEAQEGKNLDKRYEVVFCIFEREEAKLALEQRAAKNATMRGRRKRNAKRVDLAHRDWQRAQPAEQPTAGMPAPEFDPRSTVGLEDVEDEAPLYPLAPHLRSYGFVYFLAENAEQLGEEGGYYEQPVQFARWAKTSGSMWGHGPCNILLPTVKYVNAWMEIEKSAAEKAVDPTLGVTERGLMSDVDQSPGGITVFRDKDSMWVIESKARFDVSGKTINELRAMIRQGLHNDELQFKDSPAMTATEVQARYELMNRILGSTLARIENDLLSPIVKTAIGHLMRANQLPAIPESVAKHFENGSPEFNIEYQGPLARSQRTDEVAAIERVLAFAAGLLKMGIPLDVVMATIDVVAAIREVAKRLGTPSDLLKPDAEVKKALESMAAMQARAQKAQVAKVEGDAAAAHASAAASMAQAQGAGPGGAPAQGLPIPASPTPVVAPTYPPTASEPPLARAA